MCAKEEDMRHSLRRSTIYVPGDSKKMLQKAATFASDVLVLNLEDGVAVSQKHIARRNVADALKKGIYEKQEIWVRINPLNGELGKSDLAEIIPQKPDGICLPKVEALAEIELADRFMHELEIQCGLAERNIGIHAMIESAKGLVHAAEIAAGVSRMSSLIFGSADFSSDVRCQPGEDRFELLYALQVIVTAARSAGIDAIDAPCFDIHNQDLLERESSGARRLGFDGKSALHPKQLEIINRIFDVTDEEIAWAETTLAELEAAENRGRALTTVKGKLIDNPHRAAALRILNRRDSR
jgi:citrate lyase subunit beta/citryl-CoA lyase